MIAATRHGESCSTETKTYRSSPGSFLGLPVPVETEPGVEMKRRRGPANLVSTETKVYGDLGLARSRRRTRLNPEFGRLGTMANFVSG